METSVEDAYFLGRDKAETERLNKQHSFLLALSDNELIHLSIPTDSVTAVADIGTGTGIWLEDLAQRLPTTQHLDLHGFDISSAQFPKGNEIIVPGKAFIALTVHNALDPYPSEHHGRYDLVHIRLLVAGIKQDQYAVVMKNARDLLKPKGYIQWEEADTSAFNTNKTPIFPVILEMSDVVALGMQKVGLCTFAPFHVWNVASRAGFRGVGVFRRTTVGKEHLRDEAVKWASSVIRMLMTKSLLVLGWMESEDEARERVERNILHYEEHCQEAPPLINLGVVVAQRRF